MTQCGNASSLILYDVTPPIAKHGVWWGRKMRAESDLIAHGAGEYEERVFVSCQLGNEGLKGGCCCVLLEDIVEETAVRYRGEHGGGGGGNNIRTKVEGSGVGGRTPGASGAICF